MPPSTTSSVFEARVQRTDGRTWLLRVAGELDLVTSSVLSGIRQRIPAEDLVEIDASDLTFCDSAGLRAIIAFAEPENGRPVVLLHPSVQLRRLLASVDASGPRKRRNGHQAARIGELAKRVAGNREAMDRLREVNGRLRARSADVRRAT
jgi:anti-anti-sigma regulatory factor